MNGLVVAALVLLYLALAFVVSTGFGRMAQRGRGGPAVIGRDVYLDPMRDDDRP